MSRATETSNTFYDMAIGDPDAKVSTFPSFFPESVRT